MAMALPLFFSVLSSAKMGIPSSSVSITATPSEMNQESASKASLRPCIEGFGIPRNATRRPFSSERSPAAYMTGKRSPISRGKRGDSGKRILVSMRSEANASPMAALSLDISPASLPIVSASTEAASYRGLSGSGKAIASLYALSLSPVRAAMVS